MEVLSCEVERLGGGVVGDPVQAVTPVRIELLRLEILLCPLQRFNIVLLDDHARLRVDLEESVLVPDIRIDEAIGELKLINLLLELVGEGVPDFDRRHHFHGLAADLVDV